MKKFYKTIRFFIIVGAIGFFASLIVIVAAFTFDLSPSVFVASLVSFVISWALIMLAPLFEKTLDD